MVMTIGNDEMIKLPEVEFRWPRLTSVLNKYLPSPMGPARLNDTREETDV